MTDMVETEVDVLQQKIAGDDSELPVGGSKEPDEPDQGDADSNPDKQEGA